MQIFQVTVAAGGYTDVIAAGPVTPGTLNISLLTDNASRLQLTDANNGTLFYPVVTRMVLPVTASETALWLHNPGDTDETLTVMVMDR